MFNPEPAWTIRAQAPLTQWYGHVRLLEDSALGQWIRVSLDSGEIIWERSYARANHICGVAKRTIIASEMRSGGPWTADFGVYALDLGDGEPLWTNHGKWLNPLLRMLDHVGLINNQLRDSPELVHEDGVWTRDGRVLDLRTGEPLRPAPPKPAPLADLGDRSRALYFDKQVELGQGRRLLKHPSTLPDTLSVTLVDASGQPLWRREWPRGVRSNYYSHRLVGDHLVVVVHGTEPSVDVVSLSDGATLQSLRGPGRATRIEDADDRGILLSDGDRRLCWYPVASKGLYRQPAP